MSMLWPTYLTNHRDLLSCVTIDWETVCGWHAQIEKCNQVSSWPTSVEVVNPCSLTDAVRESSLGWSPCFFSVLVITAAVARSAVWNTFVARASWSLFFSSRGLLPGGLFALSFMNWSVWNLAEQTSLRCSEVRQASWIGESVIVLHSSRVRESSRVNPHAWLLYSELSTLFFVFYYMKVVAEQDLQSTEYLGRKDRVLAELIQLICSCREVQREAELHKRQRPQ